MLIKHEFYIHTLRRKRNVHVYLPKGYEDGNIKYPVFYMHDGQNLFEDQKAYGGASWSVTRQYNGLGQPQVIVVGIDHGEQFRFNEFSPFLGDKVARTLFVENEQTDGLEARVPEAYGGEGMLYLDWIVKELKPFIDTEYRALTDQSHTSIIGSSMGGLISLYAGMYHPRIFGNIGVLSPAFWFGKSQLIEEINKHPLHRNQRVFMSVGTSEVGIANPQVYVDDAIEIANLFKQKGYQYSFEIVKDGIHNEVDWERLLPNVARCFSVK